MNIKFFITSILSFFTSFFVLGQIGITGTVIDGDFNEPLPFANILLKETERELLQILTENILLNWSREPILFSSPL